MSANSLPADGYLSSDSRTTSDMQAAFENANSWGKELFGGAPEGLTLSIVSNVITPPNDACIFPIDATGGGTVNLINVSNIRDGQLIGLHCVSSSNPIIITNLAAGSGSNVPIATFSGANVVLTNPAFFLPLKYNAALNLFQEISPNWAAPGAIGATTPNTGAFTSVTLSTPLSLANGGTGVSSFAAHNLLVGEGSSISTVAPSSTSGYPLVSQGSSADPSYAQLNLATAVMGTLSVSNGGTGTSSFTAHGVLIGENTGAVVSVAPSTTSGYPLLSSGSSSDPVFAQLNLTTAVTGTLPVANGGTGATSFTAHGVLIGENTGAVVAIAPSSTSGYPLVSSGSTSDPVFAQLNLATAVTGTLPVANGGTGATSFTAHGVLIGENTGAVIAIAPSSTSGYPLLSNGVSSDPSFAQLNLASGVTGTLPVANGGTGATSFTAHGVLIGENTGAVVAVAPSSSSGFPLVSNGVSSDPSFAALSLTAGVTGTLPVANGGTGATSFATHGVIVGEGSSLSSIAPSSTSGYVLVSNGSSADPSFAQLNIATAVTGTLPVANGGTGATSLTAHGVLVGEGTSAVVSVTPSATSGYPLLSNGTVSNPSFGQLNLATSVAGTLPVGNGGTGATSFTAHGLLIGEGSTISSLAPSSTSGYPLLSNGSSSDPGFAQLNLASGVTGTLPVANGGTALSSAGTANQVLGVQTSGTGLEYKSIVAGTGVTVTNSAGQIQISSTGGGSASFPLANQCRLYGVSGSPYADTDTASPPMGAQSLYFGPCPDKGNSIFLYNSSTSSWGRVAASETSISLSSLTAGNTYDVYVYNNSGSVAIEFSTAWSGNTPPARDIDSTAGVYTKHGDPTRLYVGSIEVYNNTHSPAQLSVASYPAYIGIWNAYNRIQGTLNAWDPTAASWAATGAWRIAHALSDTSYGYSVIRIVTGLQIEAVSLNRYVRAQPDAYTDSASYGIAIDSGSSTPVPLMAGVIFATSYTSAGVVTSSMPYTTNQLGAHVYESVETGAANFESYATVSTGKIPLSGMSGTTWW